MNEKIETKPGADRGNEENAGSGQAAKQQTQSTVEGRTRIAVLQQTKERKTHRQARGELHGVLTQIIAREGRQQRIRDGVATEKDAFAEAQAIEDDATSKSRRIRETCTQPA